MQATQSNPGYDFRQDFNAIAQPGLHQYLQAIKARAHDGDFSSLRWYPAKQYICTVWSALEGIQRDFQQYGSSVDFELYNIKEWTRESVQAYVDLQLDNIIESELRPSLSPAEERAKKDLRMAHEAACEFAHGEFYFAGVVDGQVVYGGSPFFHRALGCALSAIEQARERNADVWDVTLETVARCEVRRLKRDREGKPSLRLVAENGITLATEPTHGSENLQRLSIVHTERDPLQGFMFDGDAAPEPPPMLIKRLLPAQGVCFNGGQSGVGKSFLLSHAAACLGAGEPFFGHRVHERVGSAIFAAEGQFTMPNRITVARQRVSTAPKLPIAWLGNVPNLSDPREIDAMIPRLKALSARFGDDFGVRLGAIFLDTLSAACDIQDEDDNSEAAKVGRQLQRLAAETGSVVIPTHHYGKNQETGLRGASAWRALCDIVWSATGDRNHLTGDIKNRKFALAKSRDDLEGVISGFDLSFVELGKNQYGDPFGACYVVEGEKTPAEKAARKSSSAAILERAVQEAYDRLADEVDPSPGLNGKPVRKVPVAALRDEVRSRGFLEVDDDGAINSSGRGKFRRAKEALLAAKTLIEKNGTIWR